MYNATETIIFDCSNEEMKFYISLLCNVGLAFMTILSEAMGASKCKSNGVIHSISKTLSRTEKQLNENNQV